MPWQRLAVRLDLQARRWYCANPACARQMFTEHLPTVVAPHARRAARLAQVVEALALVLGGEGGGDRLDAWLAAADACAVLALTRFAAGLRADLAAVRAGLTERWSDGPTGAPASPCYDSACSPPPSGPARAPGPVRPPRCATTASCSLPCPWPA